LAPPVSCLGEFHLSAQRLHLSAQRQSAKLWRDAPPDRVRAESQIRILSAQLENRSRNNRDPRVKGKAEAQPPRLFSLNPKSTQRVTISGGDRRRVSVSTPEAPRYPAAPPESAPGRPMSRLSLPAVAVRVIRRLACQERDQTTGVSAWGAGGTILECCRSLNRISGPPSFTVISSCPTSWTSMAPEPSSSLTSARAVSSCRAASFSAS
jgi:hypothetical protein